MANRKRGRKPNPQGAAYPVALSVRVSAVVGGAVEQLAKADSLTCYCPIPATATNYAKRHSWARQTVLRAALLHGLRILGGEGVTAYDVACANGAPVELGLPLSPATEPAPELDLRPRKRPRIQSPV